MALNGAALILDLLSTADARNAHGGIDSWVGALGDRTPGPNRLGLRFRQYRRLMAALGGCVSATPVVAQNTNCGHFNQYCSETVSLVAPRLPSIVDLVSQVLEWSAGTHLPTYEGVWEYRECAE